MLGAYEVSGYHAVTTDNASHPVNFTAINLALCHWAVYKTESVLRVVAAYQKMKAVSFLCVCTILSFVESMKEVSFKV